MCAQAGDTIPVQTRHDSCLQRGMYAMSTAAPAVSLLILASLYCAQVIRWGNDLMRVLVAVDRHIQTQMDSDLTEVKRSMLTSVSDTLQELLQLAKIHEGRTNGLVKFALSSRMQKLVTDATQKASTSIPMLWSALLRA